MFILYSVTFILIRIIFVKNDSDLSKYYIKKTLDIYTHMCSLRFQTHILCSEQFICVNFNTRVNLPKYNFKFKIKNIISRVLSGLALVFLSVFNL